ncbi:Predicted acetyltransferase, GNAT superfamily [Seinonella peptonophila]|uniref:Predicted acetyltransferase, GNAT superfamily n=1 Tax=Seinonella peptonophila TaxID=112248 RepID=A0A1M4U7I9_9BACL|nr:GNAT family N-acetyltransferase [Seinonella peptonophila]SHE52576.1 Predicted acetyltransferase, GNAT superfamily [Seinonella peptonophila]
MIHNVEIRKVNTYKELKNLAKLRKALWPDDGEVALDHMKFIAAHGGIILGAYVKDQCVGYLYSFPGYQQKQVYLILQNIGVRSDYRQQKIGEALMKRLQLEALELGYDEIIWTFEPLESINAHLYLHKMGAVVTEYLINCYENNQSKLPIDRFLAHWNITHTQSSHLAEQLDTSINHTYMIDHKNRTQDQLEPEILNKSTYVLIPIPSNFSTIRSNKETHSWRFFTRSIFHQLLHLNWEVFDLLKNRFSDESIYYYVARKTEDYL